LNESRDGRRHPNDWDLYTPLTQEVIDLLVRMRRELGSWREVAYVAGKRMREIRRIYRVEVKVVSMSMMDRLCQGSGVGHISEFRWYTAKELVEMGIWTHELDDPV
jgi:hypothetical protein